MPDQHKEEIKEAIKEWMDEKFATFGKWTLYSFATVVFGWVMYGLIMLSGWHR